MLTWAITAALVVAAPAPKEVRKLAKPPSGDWAVERLEVNGLAVVKAPDPAYVRRFTPTGVTLLFHGIDLGSEAAAYFEAGGSLEAEFHADPKRVRKAIWKVEGGDRLTICEAPPGAARPTEFSAPKGSDRVLWVLKRVGE